MAIAVVTAAICLWIRSAFPAVIWAGAAADDALFVRLARSLASGRWLGDFDDLTLVKGIGYPLFIALSFIAGIPLKVAETLVYLLGSFATCWLIARWSKSYLLGSAIFVLLAFNPVLFTDNMSRVLREGIYLTLSLASVVLTISLITAIRQGKRYLGVRSALTGLVWGWFWLTREEGIWIIPPILAGSCMLLWSYGKADRQDTWRRVSVFARQFGLALLVALAFVNGVASINNLKYGKYETVEVKSKSFERAYGAIYRVKPDKRVRYVVFPKDVRAKVYAVSPAARELASYFEGPRAEYWRQTGCDNGYAGRCPEILAGWFQWAFREAVKRAGHYTNAATAADYYELLANEINTACSAGKLDCLPYRATLTPPFEWAFVSDAVRSLPQLATGYWRIDLHVAPPGPSYVIPGETRTDPDLISAFTDIVGTAEPTVREATGSRAASYKRNKAIIALASYISMAYAPFLILLLVLSPLGTFLLWRDVRSDGDRAMLSLIVASFTAVATRAALLCYLDATAIPSLTSVYASSASPFLIIAAGLSTLVGVAKLAEKRVRIRSS